MQPPHPSRSKIISRPERKPPPIRKSITPPPATANLLSVKVTSLFTRKGIPNTFWPSGVTSARADPPVMGHRMPQKETIRQGNVSALEDPRRELSAHPASLPPAACPVTLQVRGREASTSREGRPAVRGHRPPGMRAPLGNPAAGLTAQRQQRHRLETPEHLLPGSCRYRCASRCRWKRLWQTRSDARVKGILTKPPAQRLPSASGARSRFHSSWGLCAMSRGEEQVSQNGRDPEWKPYPDVSQGLAVRVSRNRNAARGQIRRQGAAACAPQARDHHHQMW